MKALALGILKAAGIILVALLAAIAGLAGA